MPSSSSSCRAVSTDIPDPLSPRLPVSFIASVRSSGLHPVSSHSCCMYVRAGRPAFDWPYAGVHRCTISSLLLQQCPACLVRLACIVFVIGGRWPYSRCLVGCCCQEKPKNNINFTNHLQKKNVNMTVQWIQFHHL